ncbi:hypothetical protein GCM10027422_39310 [Hymenobacter arcticus]
MSFPSVSSFAVAGAPSYSPAAATAYAVTSIWETYANGEYQRATIEKEIRLLVQPNATGYVLEVVSSLPTLTKSGDLVALDNLALRLAELYKRLVFQVGPAGELLALLNHHELLQTWDDLAQRILADTPPEDQLTVDILLFITNQLFNPANFLQSLRHDYLYQALVPLHRRGEQPVVRQFANFFNKKDLWFLERIESLPSPDSEQLLLRLSGALDTHQTDKVAIKELIDKELRTIKLADSTAGEPGELPAPQFFYEATAGLAAGTGTLIDLELSVHTRLAQVYNKEYTLLLKRI